MSRSAPTAPLVRAGLVLFAILSLADVAGLALTDGKHPPYFVAAIGAALGVASLCCLVPAWRGSMLATRVLAILRIVSALTAVPAFFASGVPGAAVGSAAAIVVLTAAALVLVVGRRRPQMVAAR
jgi:hypothetical protein